MKRQQASDITDWRAQSHERFGFLLFLAAALHGVLILALSFQLPDPPPRQPTLDITLAQYQQESVPNQVDFIAQQNQQGSGTSEDKRPPTATEEAPFSAPEPRPQTAQAAPTPPQPEPVKPLEPEPAQQTPTPIAPQPEVSAPSRQQPVVSTPVKNRTQVSSRARQTPPATPQPVTGSSTSLLARSLETASLQAQLDMERQQFANRPRVRRFTAASTLSHEDAAYLDNWRRRIETIGNLNYPEQARRENIYGVLRLLVVILPDGSVQQVRILESSGHAILDDAAVRIVQLAAPFQPFPVEMRKRTDRLEIIRTWKFEKQAQVY